MQRPTNRKSLIVVDLEEVLFNAKRAKALYDVYARFPLADMVETILSISPYIDYSTHVYDILATRFDDEDIAFDLEVFDLFFELLTTDIDQTIKEQYEEVVCASREVAWYFVEWVGKTSILVRVE